MEIIASGRTSTVCRYLNQCAVTGETSVVAIKFLTDKMKAFEEISTLLTIGHPNVIGVLDIVETSEYVGIVMPLMRMDLRVFMNRVTYAASTMLQINVQTMKAVHHIHACGIVHMDIKPENVGVDVDTTHEGESVDIACNSHVQCKLLDFGSSLVIADIRSQNRESQAAGDVISPTNIVSVQTTRGYQSPELVVGLVSSSCDIYSMGVVFGELNDRLHSMHSTSTETVPQSSPRQLSLDMRHAEFRHRPSSREVLERLIEYCNLPEN